MYVSTTWKITKSMAKRKMNFLEIYNIPFSDCNIVSSDGKPSQIFEVNTTATLEWNLFNFRNGLEFFNIVYTKDKTNIEIVIASAQIYSNNETTPLGYSPKDNPFDQNRISGSLNIINGNGTVILELKNLQYDEDGVFALKSFVKFKDEFGITVKVQGKFVE